MATQLEHVIELSYRPNVSIGLSSCTGPSPWPHCTGSTSTTNAPPW